MGDSVRDMAKKIQEEMGDDYRENPLETYQQYHQRRLLQISAQINEIGNDFAEGLIALYSRLPEIRQVDGKDKLPEMPPLTQVSEAMLNVAESDKQLQEIAGLSDEAMAMLFESARLFLQEENYREAQRAFECLTLLNSRVGLFWIGYGEALENGGKLRDAQDAFTMATVVEPLNAAGYVRAAKVAKERKLDDEVEQLLNQARELIIKSGNDEKALELESELKNLELFLQSNEKS
jgi:predicted Zn-dependent protease